MLELGPHWSTFVAGLITLIVVIDPVGTISIYRYAAETLPSRLRRRFALQAVATAAAVLIASLVAGQIVLELLALRQGSFQIAGGIVLFLVALTMIFGRSRPQTEIADAKRGQLSGAVFPLAIPSIASPGTMLALAMLAENGTGTFADQVITMASLATVLVLTLALLIAANVVHRLIGDTGIIAISRVMGLVLTIIALEALLKGFELTLLTEVVPARKAVHFAETG